MSVYLVGGAVRDKLLGLTSKDADWVVVGSTPQTMLQQGFLPVGKDFPVFLHPKTKQEYALARTEKKVGTGYHGFIFNTDTSITLAQDLARRDLTINAIAMDKSGQIIDPYNGVNDLNNKLLKHVSPAFIEDPVRVLRIARFAAKFPEFTIDPSTIKLMQTMRDNGELNNLVAERVWQELLKALATSSPQKFFSTLEQLQVLTKITKIWQTVPDCNNLEQLTTLMEKFWWCCVNQPLDNINHGIKYLNIPTSWRQPTIWLGERTWEDTDLTANNIAKLAVKYDIWRRPERFSNWIKMCNNHPQLNDNKILQLLPQVLAITSDINISKLQQQGYTGKHLGAQILALRTKKIEQLINTQG